MTPHTLNCQGRLLDLSKPVVMGILNATPDSFYVGSRIKTIDAALRKAEQMLTEGAILLDVGGASSRPGAVEVPEQEEHRRVVPLINALHEAFPEALISVDTWRASVAEAAVGAGASIINDISAGRLDEAFLETVARLHVPYILMHMQGDPTNMQQKPTYNDVVTGVLDFFIAQTSRLRALGIGDIVIDPGFGFGKTIEHNYTLLAQLSTFHTVLQLPMLVGLSRKSMIWKTLDISPEQALNGSTALHMAALERGAHILRVHDVREAVETVRLWAMLS
jgi:dihydropteroate synthase